MQSTHKPRTLTMEELDALYLSAASTQQGGESEAARTAYWRALIVFAYFTGLRRGDLFKVEWGHVDFVGRTVTVSVSKTGTTATLPLHPVVITHLEQLPRTWKCIFPKELELPWSDIRRTTASEAERAAEGMGSALLLHSPFYGSDWTRESRLPKLRQTITDMRVPKAFK